MTAGINPGRVGVRGNMAGRHYAERPPSAKLAGRVARVWTSAIVENQVRRVLPDASIDIIVHPGGVMAAGPDTGPVLTQLRPGDWYVAVRFMPGQTGGVLGVPAHEVRDARIPLEELWGDEARRLEEVVMSAARPDLALEEAIARRLGASAPPDPAAAAISAELGAGRSVHEVASDLGFSERQLRRRAVAAFGYGPKILHRIQRFQHALALARSRIELADAAFRSGYADQAHMANEVRALAGVPITELM